MTDLISRLASGDLYPPKIDTDGNSNYGPCYVGLHLCGQVDDQPYTALNIPARSHEEARRMFEAAKAAAECEPEAADFFCDLCLGSPSTGDEIVADFPTNRQMTRRMAEALVEISHDAH